MSVIELNCSPSCHNLSQMTQWSLPLSNHIGIFFFPLFFNPGLAIHLSLLFHAAKSFTSWVLGTFTFRKHQGMLSYSFGPVCRFTVSKWNCISIPIYHLKKIKNIPPSHTQICGWKWGWRHLIYQEDEKKVLNFPHTFTVLLLHNWLPNLFFFSRKTAMAFQNPKTHICIRSLET